MAFSAFLHHIGAPVDGYLRGQKLPVLCDDPDRFIPLARAWSFFATTAHHEDLMLGWRVGAYLGDQNLNRVLLRKLENAPSLYQAMQGLVQMANSEASHIQLGLIERRDDVLLYTHYSGKRDVPGYRTSQSYQIGLLLDLVRHFLGRRWVPDEIGIEHTIAPAVAEELFPGCRVREQQPLGYLAVPRACLARTVQRTSPASATDNAPVLTANLDYANSLRAILRSYLPDGYANAHFMAEIMGVSERTLARRLSACGLTYGTLIDEVRFTEAKRLLLEPGMRIDDVALAIGFNDQTNFSRMFRRLSGLTPSEYRRLETR